MENLVKLYTFIEILLHSEWLFSRNTLKDLSNGFPIASADLQLRATGALESALHIW